MPRFYMHQRNGNDVIADPEGGIYVDLEDATHDAMQAARQMMSDRVRAGNLLGNSVFEITDDAGRLLKRFAFQDALSDPPRSIIRPRLIALPRPDE